MERITASPGSGGDEPGRRQYRLDIWRGGTWQPFNVVGDEDTTVLALLATLQDTEDLAVDYSCRRGSCGLCAVRANGRLGLACQLEATPALKIEPAHPRRVLRDVCLRLPARQRLAESERSL